MLLHCAEQILTNVQVDKNNGAPLFLFHAPAIHRLLPCLTDYSAIRSTINTQTHARHAVVDLGQARGHAGVAALGLSGSGLRIQSGSWRAKSHCGVTALVDRDAMSLVGADRPTATQLPLQRVGFVHAQGCPCGARLFLPCFSPAPRRGNKSRGYESRKAQTKTSRRTLIHRRLA